MSPDPTIEIDFEHATSTAARALHLMSEHNVPATPQGFEVWLAYALGTVPELNQVIKILIGNKRRFDSATNRSLYLTYIGSESDPDGGHAETSAQIHDLMSTAQDYLGRSRADNRAHVEAVDGVAPQIAQDRDPRAIVEALVAELSKAGARTTTLEANFNASLQELEKIRGHLAAAEQRSKTDALTSLANRHALDEFLRTTQMSVMESGKPLSIFLLDIDHFKTFNDKFGHQFGDQVLRLIARALKDGVRSGDLAARFGGEELVGVLPDADMDTCAAVAERIRQSIAGRRITRRANGEVLSAVTVSIGVAQFVPGETLANLFERCDRALYAAKRGGRNRTVTEIDLVGTGAAA
jgi:diguanylate cyclase